ncbi:DUF3168 domain-containing protein [Agrobacterium vitis]|uniref:DUF3168 domain-containing protein n=1 Tax=Agrobacterium vitis TaxID=373 RepID=UPI0012E9284B|nr:DUF3168 domain-containing protein [Agrobacterium vitis]MVB04162.1 DUF3168 domain-containing protein [Agrobacterium vitis]
MIAGEVQKAIYEAMLAANCCGGRVYDNVPSDAQFPYHTIGDEQVSDDSTSCGAAWIVYCDIHSWSRPASGSKAEVKAARAAAFAAISGIPDIPGFQLDGVDLETARTQADPDGITQHDILTVRFLINSL